MDAGHTEIELTMRMFTETATTQVGGRLRYTDAEPYAVTLVFRGDGLAGSPIEWIFARDLLATGVLAASGDGDVRVWPADTTSLIFFELRSPSGQAVFAADKRQVERFLAETERIVPTGAEPAAIEMDHHLATLLGGEPGLAPPELR